MNCDRLEVTKAKVGGVLGQKLRHPIAHTIILTNGVAIANDQAQGPRRSIRWVGHIVWIMGLKQYQIFSTTPVPPGANRKSVSYRF